MATKYADWQVKTADGFDTIVPNNAVHATTADTATSATSATSATNDSANNNISTTYAKNSSFGDVSGTSTELTYTVSRNAITSMSDSIMAETSTEGNWETMDSGWIYFQHKTKIPGLTLFSGFIYNPQSSSGGLTNNYWYRIALPSEFSSKNINVFTQPDTTNVNGSGSNITTYIYQNYVGICRDNITPSGDIANIRFLIVAYD